MRWWCDRLWWFYDNGWGDDVLGCDDFIMDEVNDGW